MTHAWETRLVFKRHDTLVISCVTWLIHTCDMAHSHVWHDSLTCVTWLIRMCDVHIFDVSRYSLECAAWLILTGLACCGRPQAGISFERFVRMKWFQNQLNFADVSIYTCIYRYKPKFKCIYVQIDLIDLDAGIGGACRMPSTHSHCNTLYRTAIWEMRIGCLLLQFSHAATRCNALQHATTRCSTLQHANSTILRNKFSSALSFPKDQILKLFILQNRFWIFALKDK